MARKLRLILLAVSVLAVILTSCSTDPATPDDDFVAALSEIIGDSEIALAEGWTDQGRGLAVNFREFMDARPGSECGGVTEWLDTVATSYAEPLGGDAFFWFEGMQLAAASVKIYDPAAYAAHFTDCAEGLAPE